MRGAVVAPTFDNLSESRRMGALRLFSGSLARLGSGSSLDAGVVSFDHEVSVTGVSGKGDNLVNIPDGLLPKSAQL